MSIQQRNLRNELNREMSLNNANLTICRVCMTQNGTLKSIFSLEDFSERTFQIKEVITTCASVQVEIGDGLPQEICVKCLMRLRYAFAFKNLCEESDNTLRNNLMVDVKLEIEDVLIDIKQENIAMDNEFTEHVSDANTAEEDVGESQNLNAQHHNELNIEFIKAEVNIKLENEDEAVEDMSSITGNIIEEEFFNGSLPEIKQENVGSEDNREIFISTPSMECNVNVATKQNLCTHRNSRLDINKCDICNKSCADKHHKRTHSGEESYICDVCGLCFNTKSNLDRHTKYIHVPEDEEITPNIVEASAYYKETLENGNNLVNFIEKNNEEEIIRVNSQTSHIKETRYQCDICGEYLDGHKTLWEHRNNHKYQCQICKRHFWSKKKLIEHKRHIHVKMSYKCAECGKCFLNASRLTDHGTVHRKPYDCLICDERFKTNILIRKHMRTHAGETSIKCRVCGMLLPNYKALKSHHLRQQHSTKESGEN